MLIYGQYRRCNIRRYADCINVYKVYFKKLIAIKSTLYIFRLLVDNSADFVNFVVV
jgi:hypothetical protein